MSLVSKIKQSLIDEVWPDTSGDHNAVIRATLLSKRMGATNYLRLPYTELPLPRINKRYVVLELGAILDERIALQLNNWVWYPIERLINDFNIMLTIFTQGRFISPKEGFICTTNNSNIIIAISYKYNLFIQALEDPIYVRFYKNVVYQNMEQVNENQLTLSDSFFIIETNEPTFDEYNIFSGAYSQLLNMANSLPLVFKNGYYIGDTLPDFEMLEAADVIHYLFDPFIYSQVELEYNSLESYYSETDSVNKLILSIENLYKPSYNETTYVDDLELYIQGTREDNSVIGVYCPRLFPRNLLSLTYKDWAIDSSIVTNALTQLETNLGETLTDIKLLVVRRFNKRLKNTVLASNFLQDIMELPLEIRSQVFSGANSNLDLWKAQNLEYCEFWNWCGTSVRNITNTSINLVFARAGLIKLYEGIKNTFNNSLYKLPPIYKDTGKLVTYNASGLNPTFSDISSNPGAFTAKGYEFFIPKAIVDGDLELLIPATNVDPITFEDGYGVFCYYKNAPSLVPIYVNEDYTLITVGNTTTLNWIGSHNNKERYVRFSQRVVLRTHTLTESDYLEGIGIYGDRWLVNEVGMDQMMVWYREDTNAFKLLTEGLDFNVKYGNIYLCSQISSQFHQSEIIIYYSGLPNYSLRHEKKSTWGILKQGKISNDDFYNLFLNRNKLLFVDGKATRIEEVNFAEAFLDKGSDTPLFNFPDGTVYNILSPSTFSRIEELDAITNTVEETQEMESQITQYLSAIYPQLTPTPINIVNKYDLISIFLNRIINDVINGIIVPIKNNHTLDELQVILNDYLYLLPVDPCMQNLDDTFIRILPKWDMNPVAITSMQFNFIIQVNQLILANKVVGINICLTVN
jgi:hypothetical protein